MRHISKESMLNLRIFTMSLLLIVTALMEVEQLEKKIHNLVTLSVMFSSKPYVHI